MKRLTDDRDLVPASHFEPRVPGVKYGVLDSLVGYAVRRAQAVMYEDFVQRLSALQMTPQRFSTLVLIEQNPGLTQSEIGTILGIARSGVVALIDFHEAQGWVRREGRPGDRRAYRLVLTPQGKAELARARRAVQDSDARMTAALDADERAQLCSMLERIGKPVETRRSARAR